MEQQLDRAAKRVVQVDLESPSEAIGIVSELKGNAALFAAFAFGSLNLPSTLTVSESKVLSVTTSLSTSRPQDDLPILRDLMLLDVITLCLFIICVTASQLLIYRLADGSYGAVRYSKEGGELDPRDTALGRLTTQYSTEYTI